MSENDDREIPQFLEHAATKDHWERIGVKKRFGICAPLFSLRTLRDAGVGDIGDLYPLVDWCRRIGASVIQLLPINDMGLDSVPYSALSAFALDPIYIALDRVDEIASAPDLCERLARLSTTLNQGARIDYLQVRREKGALLEEAFRRADGPPLRAALAEFRDSNSWLDDYLIYRTIKEHREYRSWEDWGEEFSSGEARNRFAREHDERLTFHLYEQWLLDRQLSEARGYANANGILLKGDIPILVSRDSADVWLNPAYFNLQTTAGAPPDMYAEEGQNWGFPTYRWDVLAGQDYSWWRARLEVAQRYFDLYRIDHVVGFFRIWTIPLSETTGVNGRYEPQEEWAWGDHGRRLLSMMLESSTMLPLAEDLGTIPPVCRETLRELGICGFKVQRWEKRWHEDHSFIQPSDYDPLSLATLSTHDSETLAGWWAAYPDERGQLWGTLGKEGSAPDRLPGEFELELIRWLARGRSLFTVVMLQDLLDPFGLLPGDPAEHRVNVPGTVGPHNWTWRSPVCLEDLLGNEELCSTLAETSL